MLAASAKGPGRPILPAAIRAELVAAIRGVDYVTIFSEPTVAPLLDAAAPGRPLQGHRLHGRHGARAGDRAGVRRPDRHRRRPERSFHPGSARPDPPMRFLIVRLGALGDIVHAVPAAAALRAAHPDAVDRLAGRRAASRVSRSRHGHRSRGGPGEVRASRLDRRDAAAARRALRCRAGSAGSAQVRCPRAGVGRQAASLAFRSFICGRRPRALSIRIRWTPKAGMSSARTCDCSRRSVIHDEEVRFPLAMIESAAAAEVARAGRQVRPSRSSIRAPRWPNKRWDHATIRRGRGVPS